MMPDSAKTQRDRVIDAVMDSVAEDGWRGCTLEAALARADLEPHAFYREFDDLYSVISAASRRLDGAMLAAADFEPEEAVRDRLFALLMARFDAARPWRQAIAELARAAASDPRLAALGLRSLHRTAARALENAGVVTGGPFGPGRIAALAAGVLLPASRVWLRDDSEDLSRTMADLDSRLGRAERWAGRMGPFAGAGGNRQHQTADPASEQPTSPTPPKGGASKPESSRQTAAKGKTTQTGRPRQGKSASGSAKDHSTSS